MINKVNRENEHKGFDESIFNGLKNFQEERNNLEGIKTKKDKFYDKELEAIYIPRPWEDPQIVINFAFKNLLRRQTEQEHEGLKKSIEKDGVIQPLLGWFNKNKLVIIDGHNRHEICCELKKPYFITLQFFDTEEDAKIFIIRHQLERRNLSNYERSRYALQLKQLFRARSRLNQGRTDVENPIDTKREIAKIAGVSHDTIQRVDKIEHNATPVIISKVLNNDLSINTAYEIAKLPQDEQKKIEKLSNKEIEMKVKEIKEYKKLVDAEPIQLSFGTFNVSDIKDEVIETEEIALNSHETEYFLNYKKKIRILFDEKVNDVDTLADIEDIILRSSRF